MDDSIVASYAANEPGCFPARPADITDSQWTGIRWWLVVWWLYAYPSTFSFKRANTCLGQSRRNRMFVAILNWAAHYGPGHFEWYYPFTWLDHFFRAPFNLVSIGDYARMRIPRNLFVVAQHRLFANLLGDRNASRAAVVLHQNALFPPGVSDSRLRIDLVVTTESNSGK